MPVYFLGLREVLALHAEVLWAHGGHDGLRSRALLESALAQPQQSFAGRYLHPDVFAMASAYLFHISQNQPFIDGNKRAASSAALTFLVRNGIFLELTNDDLVALVFAVANGQLDKHAIAARLRGQAWTGPTRGP